MSLFRAIFRQALPIAIALAVPNVAMAEPEPTLPSLQAVAERAVSQGLTPNMVIGVSLPDGEIIWIRKGTLAFGDATAANENSLYRAYSLTKPITSFAAMLLIDEGVIDLDQPVSDFIPGFANVQVLVDPDTFGETRPPARPITVRHLLTHTSGLGYSTIPSALSEAYARAGIVPGLRLPHPLRPIYGEEPDSLQAFAERVATLPLRVDPGTDWHYSIGHDVLGAVIEVAAGMPFEQFLQDRIFTPLGMNDTGFVVATEDLDRLTTNYARLNGEIVMHDAPGASEYASAPPFPSGGAGLVTTPRDYLRFMTAMANRGRLDGEQILPSSAVNTAMSNLLPEGVVFDGFGAFAAQGQGFGAGGRVWVQETETEPIGTFGFASAASSLATVIPSENTAIVMMTQMLFANDLRMIQDVSAAFATDVEYHVRARRKNKIPVREGVRF